MALLDGEIPTPKGAPPPMVSEDVPREHEEVRPDAQHNATKDAPVRSDHKQVP